MLGNFEQCLKCLLYYVYVWCGVCVCALNIFSRLLAHDVNSLSKKELIEMSITSSTSTCHVCWCICHLPSAISYAPTKLATSLRFCGCISNIVCLCVCWCHFCISVIRCASQPQKCRAFASFSVRCGWWVNRSPTRHFLATRRSIYTRNLSIDR